jgi:hypothetical protein
VHRITFFFVKVPGLQVTFETGPEGRATSLIMHRAGREPIPATPDSRSYSVRWLCRSGRPPLFGPAAQEFTALSKSLPTR